MPEPHFNGAALVGVRRVAQLSLSESLSDRTSTEPHSLECGEPVVEKPDLGELASTSTEPHSLECGELAPYGIKQVLIGELQRSRTRWSAESTAYSVVAGGGSKLQRSRTRWSAERQPVLPTARRPRQLQRSRTRWSAERNNMNEPKITHTNNFNGAALVGVRRATAPEPPPPWM